MDRDTTGGVEVEKFDEDTLLLLFRAARCKRTFQTTKTEHIGEGRSVCMQLIQTRTGASQVSLGARQIGVIKKLETVSCQDLRNTEA